MFRIYHWIAVASLCVHAFEVALSALSRWGALASLIAPPELSSTPLMRSPDVLDTFLIYVFLDVSSHMLPSGCPLANSSSTIASRRCFFLNALSKSEVPEANIERAKPPE